jgi:glutaredoxin 3
MPPSVRIFTTTTCPYCDRAKALLRKRDIAYEEVDVSDDPERRGWLVEASGGRRTVPQIFIDDHPIGGCDDLHALDRSGELERLLRRSG